MSRPSSRSATVKGVRASWVSQAVVLILFIMVLLAVGFVWIVPIEVLEQWAFDYARNDDYAKLEAVGSTDFLVWVSRIVLPVLLIWVWRVWSDLAAWQSFAGNFGRGILRMTRFATGTSDTPSLSNRINTMAWRGMLIGWCVLFAGHSLHAIGERAREWSYFRFNSGNTVLPNISESNRAVIRYLQESTPPSARIVVASDQKLFFLSYYLRPRTLFHRMHPDSEHVIPLKDQERKLAAYRLDELSPDDLAQMPHDYTLDYFEHPQMVDRTQLLSDTAWVAFLRRMSNNPTLVPPYLVRLRKASER